MRTYYLEFVDRSIPHKFCRDNDEAAVVQAEKVAARFNDEILCLYTEEGFGFRTVKEKTNGK